LPFIKANNQDEEETKMVIKANKQDEEETKMEK